MARTTRHVAVIVHPHHYCDRGLMLGIASFVGQFPERWSLCIEDDPHVRLPRLEHWNGDGIITNAAIQKVIRALGARRLPVVSLGGCYASIRDRIPYVHIGTDEGDVARVAFEHLYDLGLRRFAYCGDLRNRFDTSSRERGEAFGSYAKQAGCDCSLLSVPLPRRLGPAAQVQESLQNWLRELKPPVGLLASSDHLARYVLEGCRAVGAHVPDDFAVVGVDNDEAICNLSTPSLSSVEQDSRQIGYEGARILEEMMSGACKQEPHIVVKARGVVDRQSTHGMAAKDEEIADAMRFIQEHACDPINVSDVLAAIPLSRTTLENRFKSVFGRTLHAEIRRRQIERAKTLLSETDLSLNKVARLVGIGSVQYFITLMRKETGSTPAKTREQARRECHGLG